MRLKRRVLPDFETASLVLFGLLAAGAALPARPQLSMGPHRPTAQAQAQPQGSQPTSRTAAAVLQRLPTPSPER